MDRLLIQRIQDAHQENRTLAVIPSGLPHLNEEEQMRGLLIGLITLWALVFAVLTVAVTNEPWAQPVLMLHNR